MLIENQILKDKLVAMNDSFEQITGKKSESEAAGEYFNIVSSYATRIEACLFNTEQGLFDVKTENQDLRDSLLNTIEKKNSLADKQGKILSTIKEKLAKSKENLKNAVEDRDKIKEKLVSLESAHRNLSDEYEKLKKKIKHAKNRSQGGDSEKYCKNCKNYYKEDENFNWSCKIHTSEFTELWWCCGKKDKTAPGCKICKHESADSSETKDMNISRKSFCSSCKKPGHFYRECPRDPNARTSQDIIEEIDRLARISNEKSSKIQQKEGLDVNHASLHQKVHEYLGSSSSSSDYEETDQKFFPDLMVLKRNTVFETDETKYKINLEVAESPFVMRKLKTKKTRLLSKKTITNS